MSNIGLNDIAVYIPIDTKDNYKELERFNVDKNFVDSKIGFRKLSRKNPKETTIDISVKAIEKLIHKNSLDRNKVDCLVLITQNPEDSGLPHSSAVIHDRIGLRKNCVVFDVSLGCSGFIQGLSIVKSFMENHNMRIGILVTADPYSKIIDESDRDTSMLFGDAATASLLSANPKWKLDFFDFGTVSSSNRALHIANGKLVMSGREIFNFAAKEIPESLERVLEKANKTIDEIDLVILHQGSKFIVDTLAKRIKSEGKTPFGAKNYGNTVSSSIPIIMSQTPMEDTNFCLASGFGVGLAWASCLFEKNKEYGVSKGDQ